MKNLNIFFLVLGALCVSVSLDYGLGVSFGWWGVLFWFGIGSLFACIRGG